MSDNHDLLNDNDMCSFSGHEAEDMCFNCGDHTCGVRDITPKNCEVNSLNLGTLSDIYSSPNLMKWRRWNNS